jgi:hypothetical protein
MSTIGPEEFADNIAKWTVDKKVVVGPERKGSIRVYYHTGGDHIDENHIRFGFATGVSPQHRNVTMGMEVLTAFLVDRGRHVAIVAHPNCLGEAFRDFWPHLMQVERPAHPTVQ